MDVEGHKDRKKKQTQSQFHTTEELLLFLSVQSLNPEEQQHAYMNIPDSPDVHAPKTIHEKLREPDNYTQ